MGFAAKLGQAKLAQAKLADAIPLTNIATSANFSCEAELELVGSGFFPWEALSSAAAGGLAATAVLPWESLRRLQVLEAEFLEAISPVQRQGAEPIEALATVFTHSAPSFRDKSTSVATTNLSMTFTAPAGLAQGDLLVLAVGFFQNPGTITPPSGFTLYTSNGFNAVYTKIAGGSEPTSYTISWQNNAIRAAGVLLDYVDSAGLGSTSAHTTDGSSTTSHATGSITTDLDNYGLLVISFANTAVSMLGPIAGWASRGQVDSGGGGINVASQDLLAANSAGVKGPYSWGTSFGSQQDIFLFGIKPLNPGPQSRLPWETSVVIVQSTVAEPYEVNKGLRATLLTPWEALLGLARTALFPWESKSASARQTAGEPYETIVPVQATRISPWESLLGLRRTAGLSWEALLGLARSALFPWEEKSGTARQSAGEPFETNKGIHTTEISSWESLLGLARTALFPRESGSGTARQSGEPYESLVAIKGSRGTPWESLVGLRQLGSFAWERLARLGQTVGAPWESAGPKLSAMAVVPWESLKKLRSTAAEMWESRGPVQGTRSLVYETRGLVRGIRSDAWESRGLVRGIRSFAWEARKKLNPTKTVQWEALKGHKRPVTAVAKGPLDILKKLAALAVERYEARGYVTPASTKTLPMEWKAKLTTSTRVLPWESIIRVVRRTVDLRLEALRKLRGQSILSWESLGTPPPRLLSTANLSWESLAKRAVADALPYEAARKYRITGTLPWEVPPSVIRLLTANWEALRKLKAQPGAPIEWEGRINVSSIDRMIWESTGDVTANRVVPWELVGSPGVILSAIAPWESSVPLSVAETAAYEALAGLAKSAGLPVEALGAASLAIDAMLPIETKGNAGGLVNAIWEATGFVDATAELPYEIRVGVTRQLANIAWEATVRPLPRATLQWEAVRNHLLLAGLPYETAPAVRRSALLALEALIGRKPVAPSPYESRIGANALAVLPIEWRLLQFPGIVISTVIAAAAANDTNQAAAVTDALARAAAAAQSGNLAAYDAAMRALAASIATIIDMEAT